MESQIPVRVIAIDGQVFEGQCWAYSADIAIEEYGFEEAFLEISGVVLLQTEIKEIQYIKD